MFNYKETIKKLIASYENISGFFVALETEYLNSIQIALNEGKPIENYQYQHKFIGKKCTLTINLSEQGTLEMYLETPDKIIELRRYGVSNIELLHNFEVFDSTMKEYELSFTPLFTEEFKKILLGTEKGSILALNNGKCYACTNIKNSSIILKECFKGNVEDISIDAFKQSETFEVDLSDDNSIQELYKYAYNHRTKEANIRITYNSKHGKEYVTDIEKELKPEETKCLNIGPIRLKVIRQGLKYIWLDSDNREINRELVGRMFAWAHLALPEMELSKRLVPYVNDIVKDTCFLKEVQQLITEKKFNEIPKKAFKCQKEEMQFMTIRGLQKQESGSFDIVAFGFYNDNIIKIPCTFNDNLNELIPQSTTVVSLKEFVEFCEEKYSETILHLESEYSKYFEEHNIKKKDEYMKSLIEKTLKKHPPLFKEEDINKLKGLARIAVKTHNQDKLSLVNLIEEQEL